MRRWLTVAFLVALALTPNAQATAPTQFYASTSGSGTTCSLASPCTLAQAQTTVQATIAAGLAAPVVVNLRGGTYTLTTGLSFGAADSGTSTNPITWQSYPGESAVISGGQAITAWSLYSGSTYRANVGTAWNFRELYVNDVHVTRARSTANPTGWTRTSTGYASGTDMSAWGNPTAIEIVNRNGWTQDRCKVAAISGTTVTMQDSCWTYQEALMSIYAMGTTPAWVENAYELMASGYWYLDRTAGYLYYWPPSGSMTGLTVTAPVTGPPITVTGASNLTFARLIVAYSKWTEPDTTTGYIGMQAGYSWVTSPNPADGSPGRPLPALVQVSASSNITLVKNTFMHSAGRGVSILGGSSYVIVSENLFEDNAGGAIQVGAINDYGATKESNIVIRDNNLVGAGFEWDDSGGIVVPSATLVTVDHNEIASIPWAPIVMGWGWSATAYTTNSTVSNNYVHEYCLNYADCGGLYGSGSTSTDGTYATGTRFTHNYVYYGVAWSDSMTTCLYPDEGSSWSTWSGNVCQRSPNWLHVWTTSIHDLQLANNYLDTSAYMNNGLRVTITPNTTITSAAQNYGTPQQSIMCGAGISAGKSPGASAGTTAPRISRCTSPFPSRYWPNSHAATSRSLTAHFGLAEGSRTEAYNYAGGSPTGTWAGTASGTSGFYSARRSGVLSGYFDGTTNYIDLNNNASPLLPATSAWTVTGWVDVPTNYAEFNALSQTHRYWGLLATAPNGDRYAGEVGGGLYLQSGGVGAFTTLGTSTGLWYGMDAGANEDVYAVVLNGDISKRAAGTGAFVPQSQAVRAWTGVAACPNGDWIASVNNGDVYKRAGGTGDFAIQNVGTKGWYSITCASNGDWYMAEHNGDIYIRAGGTGALIALNQTHRNWYYLKAAPNSPDVYATANNEGIFKRIAGAGDFVPVNTSAIAWTGIGIGWDGKVTVAVSGGDIYEAGNTEWVLSQYSDSGSNSGTSLLLSGLSPLTAGLSLGTHGGSTARLLSSASSFASGSWHFVSYSRSGATFAVSVDGGAPTTTSDADASRALLQVGNIIGGRASGAAYSAVNGFFSGQLSSLRVYNRALAVAEIRSIYNAER